VCLHAPDSHPPTQAAEAEAPEAEGRRGKPSDTQNNRKKSQFFLDFEGPRKANCSQINYYNSLGTSQKVDLAILKAQYGTH